MIIEQTTEIALDGALITPHMLFAVPIELLFAPPPPKNKKSNLRVRQVIQQAVEQDPPHALSKARPLRSPKLNKFLVSFVGWFG